MKWALLVAMVAVRMAAAEDFIPAPQRFRQEMARNFSAKDGLPSGAVQWIEVVPEGVVRAFGAGRWFELRDGHWQENGALTPSANEFVFADAKGQPARVPV